MKRKIFVAVLSLSLCLLSLSGCFPSMNSGKEVSSTGQTSGVSGDQSIPSHITKELVTNITVDADVNYVPQKNYPIYHGTYKQFSEGSLVQTYLPNESIAARQTIKGSDDLSILSNKKTLLYIARDYFTFQKSEYSGYSTFISGANDYFLENMSEVYPHKKLSSLDEAGATKKVKEAIQKLGLPVDEGSLQIYSLSAESLNKQATSFMTDKEYQEVAKAKGLKHNFNASDEAYLFVYHCQKNGFPLYFNDYSARSGSNGVVTGARVHALVNQNGLVMLEVRGIPDIQSTVKENAAVVSIDTALEAVKNRYRNTILTDKMKITGISLCYFPCDENDADHSFSLTPVWAFSTETKGETSDVKGKQEFLKKGSILVNAVTGQEIR